MLTYILKVDIIGFNIITKTEIKLGLYWSLLNLKYRKISVPSHLQNMTHDRIFLYFEVVYVKCSFK